MMRTLLLIVLTPFAINSFAQKTPLLVQLDNNGNPYLNHSVGPKENFYSIGRIYNISPRVFAPYNGLELTSGLSIGQTMRIPLNETNFWQNGSRKENEVVVPVYHLVKEKETITKVSQLYKAENAAIKSWNNLSGDVLAAGSKVIIGFLKVDKTLSPLAAQGMSRKEPDMVKQQPVETKKEEIKKEMPVVKKEESKPAPVVKNEEPRPEPVKQQPVAEVKKEEVKYDPSSYSGSGFFKEEFNRQTNNGKLVSTGNGTGGVFKSTSGWGDGKYYLLMDNIEKGTIVMIKNPTNGKTVFAKVLGSVEETSPGSGLLFRLSNAAAAQLGVNADKFGAELVWGK